MDTTNNQQDTKDPTNIVLQPDEIARIRVDYKKGMSKSAIAVKYGRNYKTILKYLEYTDKDSLNKEIQEIIENTEKAKILEKLLEYGVNDDLAAEKLHKLMVSTDNKDVKAGLQEYFKLTGQYAPDKQDLTTQGQQIKANLYLPKKGKVEDYR